MRNKRDVGGLCFLYLNLTLIVWVFNSGWTRLAILIASAFTETFMELPIPG